MKIITASEANRRFSQMLRAVSRGERFTVISRGRPVATVQPVDGGGEERAVARKRLVERLKSSAVLEPVEWTRDELYDES